MSIYFPDSLFEIAGNAVNKLKEPISWSWSVSNVMDWVQYGLRLPQYVIIFKENNIDGKKLILINCQMLPSMHITDFDHIKYIAKNVRRLYGLPPDTEYHNGIIGQRSVCHVYGRYYLHLATTTSVANKSRRSATPTLFGYLQSVGMVSRCRTTAADDKVLLARLPATEYLRGGQCVQADRAVARLFPIMHHDTAVGEEDDRNVMEETRKTKNCPTAATPGET